MFRLSVRRRQLAMVAAFAFTATSCASSSADNDETVRDDGGNVVEGGEIGVFRLQVGDCVRLPEDTGETAEVEALAAIPCADEHTGEVILVENQFYGDQDEFPGEDETFRLADPRCISALDTYTGTDYETSQFDYYALTPTQLTWDELDDRELVCIGLLLDDDFVTTLSTSGSMRTG